MKIDIKTDARIFIIEGIAGAGKNTFHRELKEKLTGKLVYEYLEEDLLLSWKHHWIDNIDEVRIVFYENFLKYCETILSENPDAVFILNRFHISYMIFALPESRNLEARYDSILKKLAKLSAFVFVVTIDDDLIETRSAHIERTDPAWKKHLEKKLKQQGVSTLRELYGEQQNKILTLVKSQKLPYQIIKKLENI